MEVYQSTEQTQKLTTSKTAKGILCILSWYPFIWTVGVLIYGLIKNHVAVASNFLIVFLMCTWVVFIYIGTLTWLFLIIYLPLKKKVTFTKTLLYILIAALGTLAAIYVYEYDVFNSGVKYID